jgi:DNA-binding CsgD family transcriptional regulator/PAS domain-containing protein
VARLFGAGAAVLHTYDLQHGRLLSLHAAGSLATGPALYDYTATYAAIDPRKARSLAAGPEALGRWFHCHEAFDERFVARDPFYQHYMLPYGVRYNANVTIPVTASIGTAFVLELPAGRGPLNADECELARRLGLHLTEALRAHERVRKLTARALAAHGLLNTLAYPVWLLDADRYIFHANAAAQAQPVQAAVQAGRLLLAGTAADKALGLQLQRLAGAAHGSRTVVDARRSVGEPPTWLHLSTVVPGAVLGAFGDRPCIVATLFDPTQVRALDPFALADIFGLTPAQARVAAELGAGSSAPQIAQRLGCKETTVRTHSNAVRERLGARRLNDAVNLLRNGEALWARAATAR